MTWWRQKLEELEALEGYPIPEDDVGCLTESEGVSASSLSGVDEARREGKLDANENVVLPRSLLVRLGERAVEALDPRFYSLEESRALVRDLGRHLGIGVEHIVLGHGGDQLIDLLAHTFLEPGAVAVTIAPTYSFYRLRSALAGARVLEIPLRADFSLDREALREAAPRAHLLFLCSPNNPTGNQFPVAEIEELAQEVAGLLVVDEAYVEFAEETVLPLLQRVENLVILRTFSKAFGLAGMRLGYLLASRRVSRLFAEKIQHPYPVNAFAVRLARLLLQEYDAVRAAIAQIVREREWLVAELNAAGVRAFPSRTNFVLFEVGERAPRVWQHLAAHGVRIKYVGDVLSYRGCLRATVGSREIGRRMVALIREALE